MLRTVFSEKGVLAFWAVLANITAVNLLSISRFFGFVGFVWFSFGNPKNTKYLEIEKRCRGVSHILTRSRFIGFFGSWLGNGLRGTERQTTTQPPLP